MWMSLRFVRGRSGSGKTTFLLNEMKESLQQKPDGKPIFLIVPDQMTFLTEYKMVSQPDLKGMIRLQVYSFSRLAWRILQETGGITRLHISTTGLNMLIRKIVNENKEKFLVFKQSAEKKGFIDHLEKLVTEFKRYCISPSELNNEFETISNEPTLEGKIHDLELIYEQFENTIKQKYLASEDYLMLLAEKIKESETLKDAEVFIDGFYSFTPQEYLVIEQLLKSARKVTIALNGERSYRENLPGEFHLFRMTGETYATVYEIARLNGIEIEEDVVLNQSVRFQDESLAHLEKYYETLPVQPFTKDANIYFCEATNARAEIEGIGRKIVALVRDQGYRYKDIAVLVRNRQNYQELFETIFHDYEIPYYIDQKRPMLNHPLIEFIRSSLEIITSYWRYDPVFRAVKTDLLFPLNENIHVMREKMDRLENYCLAYGIQGDKWTRKERWHYRRISGLDRDFPQTDEEKQFEQELNESRLMIAAPINRLAGRLKKAKNGKELCTALFLYLEELDIPAKLEKMQQDAEENGQLMLSREHGQAWNGVLQLLDEYVEILGDKELSIKQFSEIIEAGLESLHFSLVPPAIDQVVIADLELSRLSDIKVAFVIGMIDGIMPMKFQEDGILTDEEREKLLSSGLTLAPTNKMRLLDEEFIAYKAFTTPAELLFLSYPLANEEGKSLIPSPYLKRLEEMFPHGNHLFFGNEVSELPTEEQLEFLLNRKQALTHVTYQLQAYKRHEPIDTIWWDGYNLLMTGRKRDSAIRVLSSLFYENKAKRLSASTVKELYGEELYGSISRMEMFNRCPFSHFMSHGLRLQERKIYRLDAPDIGEMFHSALKYVGDQVMKENLSWGKLTKSQIRTLVADAVTYLAPKLQNEILLSSNRHQYLLRKLERVILRATEVIEEQAKSSKFVPYRMELSFGPKGDLPPVLFQLKNGMKMTLVGRIDRIDKAENENGVFLRVIDYKSSSHDLNIGEVYYGLALQMLTYLDILVRYSEQLVGTKADPAGVLYFHIHNPIIKSKKLLTIEEIEELIFKDFKMTGLVLADPEIVQMMDQTLERGDSKIISAGLKTDGTLKANSKVASKEDFSHLRQYVRQVFEKTGNEIVEGNVEIAPYKMNDRVPCTYCPFKSVCQFDQTLKENNYRLLPSLNKKDAMERVKEVVKS
jgi:ATP-dependent helicase/nuclease subunit B